MQLLVIQQGTVIESVGLSSGCGQLRGVWKDRILVIVIKHQARNSDIVIFYFYALLLQTEYRYIVDKIPA
jgi:hypothetical protein